MAKNVQNSVSKIHCHLFSIITVSLEVMNDFVNARS